MMQLGQYRFQRGVLCFKVPARSTGTCHDCTLLVPLLRGGTPDKFRLHSTQKGSQTPTLATDLVDHDQTTEKAVT